MKARSRRFIVGGRFIAGLRGAFSGEAPEQLARVSDAPRPPLRFPLKEIARVAVEHPMSVKLSVKLEGFGLPNINAHEAGRPRRLLKRARAARPGGLSRQYDQQLAALENPEPAPLPVVIHVQNGKALTEYGAQRLAGEN